MSTTQAVFAFPEGNDVGENAEIMFVEQQSGEVDAKNSGENVFEESLVILPEESDESNEEIQDIPESVEEQWRGDVNSAEYAEWKRSQVIGTEEEQPIMLFSTYYGEAGNRITNDYLDLVVQNGTFSFYTTGGDPDSTTDNNVLLLYDGTSQVVLNIDEQLYRYASNEHEVSDEGDKTRSNCDYDDVNVEQEISFVYNPYTQRNDTAEFKYTFTNNSDESKSVGARIFFDIMLAYNDGAPFKIPGYGDVVTETGFSKDEMFQVWQTFDDLSNPTVVASGTLYNNISEKPDEIQFLNWSSGNDLTWDCSIYEGESIGDTAVNVYFDPVTIAPGETRTVKTYYGLSSLQGGQNINMGLSAFAPTELVKDEETNSYISNPFTVNGFVENKTDVTLTNVKATLNLPEELYTESEITVELDSIESGENKPVAWQIGAYPQYKDSNISYSVTLSAEEVPEETSVFYIHLPRLMDDFGNFPTEKMGVLSEEGHLNAKFEIYEDVDYFSFTPDESGTYAFESVSIIQPKAQLYDGETLIGESTGTGIGKDSYIIGELEKDKTYYLKLSPNDEESIGDYSLCVNKLSDDAGNKCTTSKGIEEKTETDGVINYPCDVDVYSFETTKSGWYTAVVSGEFNSYVELLDEEENLLIDASSQTQYNTELAYKLNEGQVYYVKVYHEKHEDKDDAGTGAYSLIVAYDEEPPVVTNILPTTEEEINKTIDVSVYAADNVAVDKVSLKYSYDQVEWNVYDTKIWQSGNDYEIISLDTTTLNDGVVYISVDAIDETGNVSVNAPVRIYTIDNTSPEQVQITTAISTVGANYITWQKSVATDAEGYNIYRSSDDGQSYSKLIDIPNVDTLFYVDTNVTTGNGYIYKITAYDNLYQESEANISEKIVTNNDMESDEAIRNLTVLPDKTTFFVGETATIVANIEYINGETKNVTSMLSFSMNENDIVSIDTQGNVKGLAAGNVLISVTVGERNIEIPYVIKSITASISSDKIVGNGKEQLTVKHHTLNGVVDVTASAEYNVDKPEIITVNSNGEVQAHSTGQAVISVSFDGQTEQIVVTVYAPPGKVTITNVPNQEEHIEIGKVFTWQSSQETTSYNIYMWKDGSTKPTRPTSSNIVNTMYRPNLEYNTKYFWQIESVNQYATTMSDVFEFSTIGLPDLECISVSAPNDVYSESPIVVSWEIKNTGTQSTDEKQWYDYVYLSPSETFDSSTAIFLGRKVNYSYLNVGESYRNEETYTIPRGTIGKYYVFVLTDYGYNVRELNDSNNSGKSSGVDVKLCPQPDLVTQKVNAEPSNVISGNQITVTWKVENEGNDILSESSIGSWIDKIYLSKDENISSEDVCLASVPITVSRNDGDVNSQTHIFFKDNKYEASKVVTIPQNIYGDYYIIVASDNTDIVYENDNSNNADSKKITVTLDPPADIVPVFDEIPNDMVSAGKYTIKWKDTNEGSRDISNEFWNDRIFIDKNETIDMKTAQLLKSVNGIKEGEINSAEVTIPTNIDGEYYIHIVSDYSHKIFEYNTYDNNTISKKVNITLRDLPDLTVKSVSAPTEGRANETIKVDFTVVNSGQGSTVENSWRDAIYISEKAEFDNTAKEMATISHVGNVSSLGEYNVSKEITIPANYSGNYYIYVKTDSNGYVQETDNDSNNIAKSEAVNVLARLASDLQVTKAKSSGTSLETGAILPISWVVSNNDLGTAKASWTDAIYLSTSITDPYENSVRLGTVRHSADLKPGEDYKVEQNFVLSGQLNGTYYIYVLTDIYGEVFEKDNEGNNYKLVDVIVMEGETEVVKNSVEIEFTNQSDISIEKVEAPTSAEAGQEIEVKWNVKNISEETTNSSSWSDSVYIVPEDKDDYTFGVKLGSVSHVGALNSGEDYDATAKVTLPYNLSGNYKIHIIADQYGRIIESDRTNNIKVNAETISVTAAKAVDFAVELDDVSSQVTAGQPLKLSWTVTNGGEADATGKWYDAVYLAYTETTLDMKLAEVVNPKELKIGESYVQTATVNLPANITGPMYIIIKANNMTSSVYELNFDNNKSIKPTELVKMDSVDLTVGNIVIPTVAYPGNDITVNWDVVNLSTRTLNAVMTDNVYISADEQWDIDDIAIGELTRNVTLAGNSKNYESLTVAMPDYETLSKLSSRLTDTMPGVQEGQYYVIVRTDVRNQVNENDKTNNRVASSSTLDASVPRIEIGEKDEGIIYHQGEKYYRFTSEGGESINIGLVCDDDTAANEIYVSYNKVPTANEYDFKFTNAMAADQDITVPVSQKGEYYVYVKNISSVDEGTGYDMTVNSIDYGVSSVYPNKSTQGKVTLKLSGALLEANMTATLSRGKIRVKAEEIYYFDSSNVYATFDMSYAPYGTYTLTVDCNGNITTLSDCFTVENNTVGELSVSMNAPTSYQVNSVGSGTIRYKNIGHTDIPAPILVVSAGNVMFKKADSNEFSYDPMVIYGYNNEGPAGILPPGAEAAYNFAFKATSTGDVKYSITTFENIGDLGIEKKSLTSDSGTEEILEYILQSQIGYDGKSYTNALSKIASYHSQFGYRTNDVDELLSLLYDNVNGNYSNTVMSSMEDIVATTDAGEILFLRQYTSSVADRSNKSIFGYGWITEFDGDVVFDENMVALLYPGGMRLFEKDETGSYPEIGGNAIAENNQGTITILEYNGSKSTYGSNGKISTFTDSEGVELKISYDGDKITELAYPQFSMYFEYNEDGYVKKLYSNVGHEVNYTYSGDFLTEVDAEKGKVTYEYDETSVGGSKNALVKINHIDGVSTSFSYDSCGRLAKETKNAGILAQTYKYGNGGKVSVIDALGNETQRYYNRNGRIVRTIDAEGRTTEVLLDVENNSSDVIESLFARSTYYFNDKGDVVKYVNPMGMSMEMEYDSYGNVASIIDEKGHKTKYEYGDNGKLNEIIYSDNTSEQYVYNIANQMTKYVNRNGDFVEYSYDQKGNVSSKDYSDGNTVTYIYDDRNNITSVMDKTGTTIVEYDSFDQIVKVTYGDGKTVSYEYDSIGRKTKMVDTENESTYYEYDSVGRLTSLVGDDGNSIVKYTYDKMNRVTKQENGNGTYTTYSYTPTGNIKRLINYDPDGGVNSKFEYSYDRFGNVSSVRTDDGVYYYEYDLLRQLISATDPDGTVTRYSYDATGNRISEQIGNETTYYTTNVLNEYTSVGQTTYSYDAAGNLITKVDESGTTTYSYDIDGNIVNISSPLGLWEYSYNAMGDRVSASKDGVTTSYLYDVSGMGSLIAEYSGSDVTKYKYGIGLVAAERNNERFWYDYDMQGSTVGVTDARGKYVNKYKYSPDGDCDVLSEAFKNPYRFSGRWGTYTDDSGLNHIRERYYDSSVGRFTSLDNYGQNISTNGYIYANNNAVCYIDADGNFVITAAVATVIIGSGVIGGAWSAGTAYLEGKRGWDLGIKAISGSVSGLAGGALAFTGVGAAAIPFITSGISSAIDNTYECATGKEDWKKSVGDFAFDTAVGGLLGNLVNKAVGPVLKKIFPSDKWRLEKQIKSLHSILHGKTVGNKLAQTLFKKPFSYIAGKLKKSLYSWISGLEDEALKKWLMSMTTQMLIDFLMSIYGSLDPNDMIGPISYGDANWVAKDAKLDYMIRCENDPEFATAPVQYLTITQKLDENLDLRSFRLGSYGFGGMVFDVPENKALYQTRLDLREEMGLYVDVWAGIDVVSGIATWTFTAIDPETGVKPIDPLVGFLPVNNKEVGDGEGFATYTVKPKKETANGERIDAVATIVFDNNAPIDTPEIFNTVDAVEPESQVTQINNLSGQQAVIEWNASDNADGSGYAGADVYVSIDMSPFVLAMMVQNEQKAIYETEPNKKYEFFVRAKDNAGNYEGMKNMAEKEIDNGFEMQKVEMPRGKDILNGANENVQMVELTTATEGADIFYTLDGEIPTTESEKYTGTFSVPYDGVVKAIAVKQGMIESELFVYSYENTRKLTPRNSSTFEIDATSGQLTGVSEKMTADAIKDNFQNENIVIKNANGQEIGSEEFVGTGSVVQLVEGDTVINEATVILKGDTTGDGKCNVSDLVKIFNHIQGNEALTGIYKEAAYVNADTKINVLDLVALFNVVQN